MLVLGMPVLVLSTAGRAFSYKELSVRIHDCPHCGLVLDRDHNAAVNILALGLQRVNAGGALWAPDEVVEAPGL